VAIEHQKIRIRLKAFDSRLLDKATGRHRRKGAADGGQGRGADSPSDPYRTVHGHRSPHGDKKSREQFEIRTHKRLLDIHEPPGATIDALMKLDLPAGVEVEIKL